MRPGESSTVEGVTAATRADAILLMASQFDEHKVPIAGDALDAAGAGLLDGTRTARATHRGQRGRGHGAARNGTESAGPPPPRPRRQGPKARRLVTRILSTPSRGDPLVHEGYTVTGDRERPGGGEGRL